MNEKLIEMIKELCCACAVSIDRIAIETGFNQTMVAKLYISTFQEIINKMEGK